MSEKELRESIPRDDDVSFVNVDESSHATFQDASELLSKRKLPQQIVFRNSHEKLYVEPAGATSHAGTKDHEHATDVSGVVYITYSLASN